jgi:hypothetical protein
MNYQAFTNDSLTTMYEVVRGALDADDTMKVRGEEIRFRVRETPDWKQLAADLEMEMIRRGMMFKVIDWSELPLAPEWNAAVRTVFNPEHGFWCASEPRQRYSTGCSFR